MRKIINIFVVVTLIASIVGTGVIVYIETSSPTPVETTAP